MTVQSMVATYTYDPWGKLISNVESGSLADLNPLRYRGYYYDSETGFYYLQSRYYDPAIGRFINADIYATTDATNTRSSNMFAYCENDPVNYYDDNGNFCVPAAVVGGVLNAALTVAGACVDSISSGEAINGKALAVDTAVSFASGFVQGGIEAGAFKTAVSVASTVWSFGSTLAQGGTLEDAIVNTATSLVASGVSDALGSQFGKTTADKVAKEITSFLVEGSVNSIKDCTKAATKATTKKNKQKTKNSKTTYQVRVHAFGAW